MHFHETTRFSHSHISDHLRFSGPSLQALLLFKPVQCRFQDCVPALAYV